MCFGGGGGGGGQDSTYFQNIYNDQINQQNQILAQQRQDALNAQNQATADKAAAENTFQTNLAQAKSDAQTTAQKYFSDRGIPMDSSLVDSIIKQVNVPDLDPNPQSYYTPGIFAAGVNQAQDAQRTKYSNLVDTTFTPGFEKTLLPDASTDPIVNSILGEQQKTAQQIVDYNKNRGLLNDTGYAAAEQALGQQASAGRATLSNLASSVLGSERQGLTDIRGNAGTAASGYNYGAAAPDISGYYGQASDLASRDMANLEGSIRGALGSTNLFDAPTALAKGGTMQGPINITTADTGAPSGPAMMASVMKNRGLGSTGVF
jgi:hypothetical protein